MKQFLIGLGFIIAGFVAISAFKLNFMLPGLVNKWPIALFLFGGWLLYKAVAAQKKLLDEAVRSHDIFRSSLRSGVEDKGDTPS